MIQIEGSSEFFGANAILPDAARGDSHFRHSQSGLALPSPDSQDN